MGASWQPRAVLRSVAVSSFQLWTAEQVAERWQVSVAHVYRLTREGKIPTVKVGRYYRYLPKTIEKWEEEQR